MRLTETETKIYGRLIEKILAPEPKAVAKAQKATTAAAKKTAAKKGAKRPAAAAKKPGPTTTKGKKPAK